MMGPQDDKGIIPRLCESLFAVIEEVRRPPDCFRANCLLLPRFG